jgi:enamine deaminase RidA (YjgF/YER057c/UK114 family)
MSDPGLERAVHPKLLPPPGYSHVVSTARARLVVTAGAVPLDESEDLVGGGDFSAQTRKVLENLALALEVAGATPRDVMKTTVYVVAGERGDLARVWEEVRNSGFHDVASTLLGVSMLGYEGQLVEIEAVAAVG